VAEWDSEIEVDHDLARALIVHQFPSLDVTSLRRLGEGWDNTVWATGEDIVFRFPRREIAIPGIKREMALLPRLASRLPAPIPNAAYPGAASPQFPWPWFGSSMIDGTEIALIDPSLDRRDQLAANLGEFLSRLHSLQLSVTPSLEIDPLRRADMPARIPRTRAALEQVSSLWEAGDRAEPILNAAESLPTDRDPVLVHGDLNLRHALISTSGSLAGVIDWGDMCQAPRSVDLPLYWSLFDRHARSAFRAAYGQLTDADLARARVLALFFDATLATYANDKGLDSLKREALKGLSRTVTD
jgi:aminoglycoside phosphotransferase (APT) family kinase protein